MSYGIQLELATPPSPVVFPVRYPYLPGLAPNMPAPARDILDRVQAIDAFHSPHLYSVRFQCVQTSLWDRIQCSCPGNHNPARLCRFCIQNQLAYRNAIVPLSNQVLSARHPPLAPCFRSAAGDLSMFVGVLHCPSLNPGLLSLLNLLWLVSVFPRFQAAFLGAVPKPVGRYWSTTDATLR